jgi:hypothetical protein
VRIRLNEIAYGRSSNAESLMRSPELKSYIIGWPSINGQMPPARNQICS